MNNVPLILLSPEQHLVPWKAVQVSWPMWRFLAELPSSSAECQPAHQDCPAQHSEALEHFTPNQAECSLLPQELSKGRRPHSPTTQPHAAFKRLCGAVQHHRSKASRPRQPGSFASPSPVLQNRRGRWDGCSCSYGPGLCCHLVPKHGGVPPFLNRACIIRSNHCLEPFALSHQLPVTSY